MDKFEKMWEQQEGFMNLLHKKRGFPKFPVDIYSKDGQKFLKTISHECMGELFEANQELKNCKSHRATEVSLFNKEAYVEELADSMHYLFEIIIASGVTLDEFYDAYMSKGKKNFQRIEDGY